MVSGSDGVEDAARYVDDAKAAVDTLLQRLGGRVISAHIDLGKAILVVEQAFGHRLGLADVETIATIFAARQVVLGLVVAREHGNGGISGQFEVEAATGALARLRALRGYKIPKTRLRSEDPAEALVDKASRAFSAPEPEPGPFRH